MTIETDRELLELAAKAAGYTLDWIDDKAYYRNERGGHTQFMPHADDGDALRLAVKLGLFPSPNFYNFRSLERLAGQDVDDYTATRRAIVRAAAEIGRAMP